MTSQSEATYRHQNSYYNKRTNNMRFMFEISILEAEAWSVVRRGHSEKRGTAKGGVETK